MKSPLFPLVDEFDRGYTILGGKVYQEINRLLKKGYSPAYAVDAAVKKYSLEATLRAKILDSIVAASALGAGVSVAAVDAELIKNSLQYKIWPGDKLSLSSRISSVYDRKEVIKTIRDEVKKQKSFYEQAVKLTDKQIVKGELPKHLDELISKSGRVGDTQLKREIAKSQRQVNLLSRAGAPTKKLKASYQSVIDAVKKGNQRAVERATKYAIMDKTRYNAARIARTEMAKAAGLTHDYKAYLNRDVVGVKYSLSSRHPRFDICDYHTQVDLYGMGPGVYPKNKHPRYPFHPHCLCIPSDIIRGETPKPYTKANYNNGAKWVKSQKESDLKKMTSKKGFAEIKKKPKSYQDNLYNYGAPKLVTEKDFKGLTPEMIGL